jgi:hypothetical protein
MNGSIFDADEFVSDEFVNEVAIKIQDPNYNGYTIQFQNYFMGKKNWLWLWFK